MKLFAKRSCRLLACALAAAQLLSAAAGAAFSNGFSYSYPVGEGLTYTRTEGKNSAGVQRANVLTYQPNTGVQPIMVYADEQLYGSQATITNAVSYLESQGKKVIGGTNADFFVMSSGVPIGLVIDEGELISSDAWQYAVGFKADGTAVMGRPTMNMTVSGTSGKVTVSYFNKTRTTAGAYLLDRNYDDSTHFSANGSYIVLERLDSTPVQVNSSVKLKVVDKGTGNTPLTIADNQMILTKSDGANVPSWVDFPIGEEVTLWVGANDSNWEEVESAVGGKLLIDDSTVTTSGIDAASSRRARSAIGVKADGTVVLYEIDGNQSSYSVGLTADELGQALLELGCVRAICLDGGGSSAMALRQPGEETATLISKPSDGSQRACANYIFFVNNVASDGVTAHAVLTPSYRYLMPGASTWFSVKGADASYGPAEAPTDLSYTVANDLGTVEGQTFTAGMTAGKATITGSNGTVSGSMEVCITGDIHSITLQSGGKDISSISVKPGESVDVNGIAYRLNQKMASVDTSFTWSVSASAGTVDENGVFTAGDTMASGTLTCSYGNTSKSITVNVGMGNVQDAQTVADFESDTDDCTATTGITLSRVTDYTEVARGTGSLKATYDGTKVMTATISLPQTDVSSMTYLTLWARGTGTQGTLTAVFADAEGNEVTAPLSAATTDGWKQLTATVPDAAITLTGLRFDRSAAGAASSALYLDQIVVSAHHAVTNTDAPAVSLDKTELTVSAGSSATITGKATMESGKYPARASNITVKVDGKVVSGAATMSGSTLTVQTGALAAGTHSVTIDVSDDAGNRTRVAATVTAGNAANVFADTDGHWARGYASQLYERDIMQGETGSDGKTYFNPDRNLTRKEFAVTIARLLGLDTSYTGETAFDDDASIPSWARGAIYAVSEAGIMQGSSNGDKLYFDPDADMTRAEVMTVIGRCLPRGYAANPLTFSDAASVPSWALEQVKICVSADIISGYNDNTLQPLGKITRGEIAKILALF